MQEEKLELENLKGLNLTDIVKAQIYKNIMKGNTDTNEMIKNLILLKLIEQLK
jgi:hypothetical protein